MVRTDAIAEHPNLLVAQGLWSSAAEGDAEKLRGFLANDVIWTSVGHNPLSGERRGPEEVLDYLALVGETADDFVSRLDDIFVSSEGAVVTYRVEARRGERRLEMEFLLILRIHAGKVANALMVAADQYANDEFWG